MTTTPAALRDQFTAALRALEVESVPDPDMDAYDAALVLSGALAFRLADIVSTIDHGDGGGINTTGVRVRFSRGWNDVAAESRCDASDESAVLAVITDLIGAAVHDNAVKAQNPYAKAASFAVEAAAALLYLATEPNDSNATDPLSRAGAHHVADDRLTHAHAWLAHLGSTS